MLRIVGHKLAHTMQSVRKSPWIIRVGLPGAGLILIFCIIALPIYLVLRELMAWILAWLLWQE